MIIRRKYDFGKKYKKIEVLNHQITSDVSNQILIMGDSTVKRVRGYKLSWKVENCKVYVKSFSGAKVMCMEDYANVKNAHSYHFPCWNEWRTHQKSS